MTTKEFPFTELLSKIVDNRGRTCPTADTGIPLIATNCIRNEQLYPSFEKVRYVSKKIYDTWFRGHPEPGDLIFVCKGTPGRVCMTPDPVGFCIAQDMVAVRANPKKIYSKYLFAVLRSSAVQAQISNLHVGTLIPHFKKGDFDKLLLPVPDMETQAVIGNTYFELSAKIELNRRMNATLEAMARALFQSWFVDFDPVRAKMEGRQPDGLDPAALVVFPAAFQDSLLGSIPLGWTVGTIQDCCTNIQNGGTPRRSEPRYWENGDIPWLTSGEVRQAIITTPANSITEAGQRESSAKWVSPLSTVVALYGATAGQVSLVSSRLTTNQAVCALVPKMHFAFFNYLWMRTATAELENKAVGSAQQNISKGIIEETKVILPPIPVLEKFSDFVSPIFELWIANLHQSRTLAALRDTLLPKLLSGEVRVGS
jgi:type I restriction enzyme S subunit